MVGVITTVAGVSLNLLYWTEVNRQSELLHELALSESRLIKSVITSEAASRGLETISNEVLAELTGALAQRLPKAAFGDGGKFILTRRAGDRIILSRRGQPFVLGSIRSAPMRSDLGIPLSRSLCQLHGSELKINSVKGTGTTISVMLPPERILKATGSDHAEAQAK
jgi:hypothetical protein